jgi:hypothetical protein
MSSLLTAMTVSGCMLAAIWLGMRIRLVLPQHHLTADTKDAVKLAMGLIATMSALVLGLLVSSAKGSYDTTRGQVIQLAAKMAFVDRMLAAYGPEGVEARNLFRSASEEAIRQIWPEGAGAQPNLAPDAHTGDAVYAALQHLVPKDEMQRGLKAQIISVTTDLAQLRTLLFAQTVPSISKPLLVVVVAWLVVIFLSFSLLAPPNATAALALTVAALSVAGAIFLILELDHPFGGLIRISSEPMRNALSHMTH